MKAIVSSQYGSPDTLEYIDVERPVPNENQVLVKIHAASINKGNLILLKGEPYLARLAFGLRKPKFPIPGGDIAGIVVEIGKNVKHFKLGDEVYGDLSGYGWGGFAEYAVVPEEAIAPKPSNLSFEEAAAVPMAALTAFQSLRDKGKVQEGQKVLIYGASGGVGTFAVQFAKAFGADVTAVCSTRNVEMVESIGADHVIDYKKNDFSRIIEQYDLIIGANGEQPIKFYLRALRPNGKFVHVGGSERQLFQTMLRRPWISMTNNKKVSSFLQRPNQNDLILIKEMIEEGEVTPVIDRHFQFHEIPEAFRYFSDGHAKGKIVITIANL